MSHPGAEEILFDEGETAFGLFLGSCLWFLFGVFVWFGVAFVLFLIMLCFLPLQ